MDGTWPGGVSCTDAEHARAEDAGLADDAVTTVGVAVHHAVMECEAVLRRWTVENSAFADIWRE